MGWTRWNGTQINQKIKEASNKSVEKTCEVILSAAVRQVPLDEGILQRTGIFKVRIEGDVIIGIISFGGGQGTGHPIVPYAIRWHEVQANFQHGRKWKYLSDPYNQLATNTLKSFMLHELRRVMS